MAPARAGSAGSSDEQPPEAGAPQDGGLADMGAATSTQVYLSCFPGARPSLAQYNCKHSHRLWCHACMWAHMLTSVPAKAEYVQLMLLCQLRGLFLHFCVQPYTINSDLQQKRLAAEALMQSLWTVFCCREGRRSWRRCCACTSSAAAAWARSAPSPPPICPTSSAPSWCGHAHAAGCSVNSLATPTAYMHACTHVPCLLREAVVYIN